MPRMKLTVTAQNIEDAIRNDANNCMIAQALKEKIPTARWVLVDLQTIKWTDRDSGLRFTYLTPKPVQKALLSFDKGETVKPFHLTLPPPTVKPIVHRAAPRKAASTKKESKKVYKKKKVAPERVAVRRHGLRLFE